MVLHRSEETRQRGSCGGSGLFLHEYVGTGWGAEPDDRGGPDVPTIHRVGGTAGTESPPEAGERRRQGHSPFAFMEADEGKGLSGLDGLWMVGTPNED